MCFLRHNTLYLYTQYSIARKYNFTTIVKKCRILIANIFLYFAQIFSKSKLLMCAFTPNSYTTGLIICALRYTAGHLVHINRVHA